MGEGAGLPEWLWVLGQGAIVVLFIAFFSVVLRLGRHLADSDCVYNPARPQDGSPEGESEGPGEQNSP